LKKGGTHRDNLLSNFKDPFSKFLRRLKMELSTNRASSGPARKRR